MKINKQVMYSQEQIAKRVKELGKEITATYNDDKEVLCVCVLRGAVLFFSDLVKEIKNDKLIFDFVTLSSYESAMYSSGKIKLIHDLRESVEDRHVLVVEDIIDSGYTVEYLQKYFLSKNPLSLKIACLLDKPKSRVVPVTADFVAFTLDRSPFIIGYGLDVAQKYRNLDAIYEVIE